MRRHGGSDVVVFPKLHGSDIKRSYKIGRELGKGGGGVVCECRDCGTGQPVAATKIIPKAKLMRKDQVEELRVEVSAMKRARGHPNVVELKKVFEDDKHVHLVMDLCKGGDLYEFLARETTIGEKLAAQLISQILLALRYCHSKGILHRDIKPENVLICEEAEPDEGNSQTGEPTKRREARPMQVKLADFGLAVLLKAGQQAVGMHGSSVYMAPEVVCRNPYGVEVDMWGVGVILYTALSGFMPFWGSTDEELFVRILRGKPDYDSDPWPSISDGAKDLIRWLLVTDPRKRATADEALCHPWLQQHCPDVHLEPLMPLPSAPPSVSKSSGSSSISDGSVVSASTESDGVLKKKLRGGGVTSSGTSTRAARAAAAVAAGSSRAAAGTGAGVGMGSPTAKSPVTPSPGGVASSGGRDGRPWRVNAQSPATPSTRTARGVAAAAAAGGGVAGVGTAGGAGSRPGWNQNSSGCRGVNGATPSPAAKARTTDSRAGMTGARAAVGMPSARMVAGLPDTNVSPWPSPSPSISSSTCSSAPPITPQPAVPSVANKMTAAAKARRRNSTPTRNPTPTRSGARGSGGSSADGGSGAGRESGGKVSSATNAPSRLGGSSRDSSGAAGGGSGRAKAAAGSNAATVAAGQKKTTVRVGAGAGSAFFRPRPAESTGFTFFSPKRKVRKAQVVLNGEGEKGGESKRGGGGEPEEDGVIEDEEEEDEEGDAMDEMEEQAGGRQQMMAAGASMQSAKEHLKQQQQQQQLNHQRQQTFGESVSMQPQTPSPLAAPPSSLTLTPETPVAAGGNIMPTTPPFLMGPVSTSQEWAFEGWPLQPHPPNGSALAPPICRQISQPADMVGRAGRGNEEEKMNGNENLAASVDDVVTIQRTKSTSMSAVVKAFSALSTAAMGSPQRNLEKSVAPTGVAGANFKLEDTNDTPMTMTPLAPLRRKWSFGR